MQQQPKPSQRILCLIDSYPSESGKQGTTGAKGELGPITISVMEQLDRHPGQWAVVHEALLDMHTGELRKCGIEMSVLASRGYECKRLNRKTYARKPLKDAPALLDLVARKKRQDIDPLPDLQPDEFGWSRDEITQALATAKSWLFPLEGEQAA